MTPRQIARQQLHEQMPTLLAGKSVIVLAPVDEADESVIETAWEFARAVVDAGKRAALVDLSLGHPVLESRAQDPRDKGIVDAFLFGVSLEHVSRRQGPSGLYFIGVGSEAPDPSEIWRSERWARLVRGFASQGAVLLLFVPIAAVDQISVTADLLVVLTGTAGVNSDQANDVTRLEQSGVPVVQLTSVRVTTPVALHRHGPAVLTDPEQPAPAARTARRWFVGTALGLTVVASTALALALILRDAGDSESGAAPPHYQPRSLQEADASVDTSVVAGQDTGPVAADVPIASARAAQSDTSGSPADSLYYTVQVAALSRLGDATAGANRLSDMGFPATVTAFRPNDGRILYRVLAGAHRTNADASRMRLEMRERGILDQTVGILLRTPFTLQVQLAVDTANADATVAGLRDSGTATYIVSMPGGTVRILTGAFETPEQARLTDSILSTSGSDLSFVLVSRTGTTR